MPFRLLRRTFGRVESFAELPTSAALILRTGYLIPCAAAVMLQTAIAALPARAQIVRGTVTERGTSRPLAGVLLSVLDERDSIADVDAPIDGRPAEVHPDRPRWGRELLEPARERAREPHRPSAALPRAGR